MKKSLAIFALLSGFILNAQGNESLDTTGVRVLDRMAEFIGSLGSVSFTANISQDVSKSKFGLVKEYSKNEVYMVGPDKMHVQVNGSTGHKGYWYNGETIVYYSFDENNYSVIDAPSDIVTMMDSINRTFAIEFPAADIFFPGFVDIILENFPHIEYLGEKEVDGVKCFHIMAVNESTNLQLWIANNAFFLPERFLIIHKDDMNKQYEVNFTNWEINPDLPEDMFSFEPPPKAKNIAIMATKSF
ncbi:hypothetical protein C8P64_1790 [Christiangramia gaetbulicola]|uniref:DUF2092 domain-containing protein n=1 Tax=Christiangramia gaetbulicola TaxID=703340 RepID=A0A2T6AHG9_9FLAO|nr:DUF2092 domain-containing protein [Christiangramia gaetbulicola]PTX43263.1 hypothetical protein C8P64_1790 [Christiangramia gaetbulicola]